jgi:hypothetical protein
MNPSIYKCNKLLPVIFCVWLSQGVRAQKDTAKFIQRVQADTSGNKMNMDAVYGRPFLTPGKLPIAIGGYIEVNTQYTQTDGISEGLSFQFRRMTLFFSSTIARKIKFLSELEFEDGTKEINIEHAAIDLEFHPLLNVRTGIIMNPIGAFNQNHDGPRWDFIDRPLSATTILPATLSNAGFGAHGKYFSGNWILGYEAYLSNGFDDRIIDNAENRTSLAAGKSNPEKFEESNSGLPMYTAKIAIRNRKLGEIGISGMSGVYNQWRIEGISVDKKRNASALALDASSSLLKSRITITGEMAKVMVELPEGYIPNFGSAQAGYFFDIVGNIVQRPMLGWEKAKINLGIRLEYVDYNQDTFIATNEKIADETRSVTASLAFRPTGTTVLRLNYRYQEKTDLLRNPPTRTGIIQVGISSYF